MLNFTLAQKEHIYHIPVKQFVNPIPMQKKRNLLTNWKSIPTKPNNEDRIFLYDEDVRPTNDGYQTIFNLAYLSHALHVQYWYW